MAKTPHGFVTVPNGCKTLTDFGTLPETKNSHLNISWIVRFLSIFKWFHFRQVLQVWTFQGAVFSSGRHLHPTSQWWKWIGLISMRFFALGKGGLRIIFHPPNQANLYLVFFLYFIQTHRIESYIGDIVGCILSFQDIFKDLTMDMADWLVVSILYAQIPYIYIYINVCL